MGRGRGCASLGTLCARRILREPGAFRPNDEQAALCLRRCGGVWFHPARLSAHDPSPEPVRGTFLRCAQLTCHWPSRLVSMCGSTMVVWQHTGGGLGTGAAVWGAAVTLCE